MKKLLLVLTVCAIPSAAIAANTPNLDQVTDTIKEYLWKERNEHCSVQHVPRREEMCGSIKMDDEVKMYLRTATVEAPAEVIVSWYTVFKKKMREVLVANPDEAREFCK